MVDGCSNLKPHLLEIIPFDGFLKKNSDNKNYQKIGSIVSQSEGSYFDILSFKDGSLERQLNSQPGFNKYSIWEFKKDLEAYVFNSLVQKQVHTVIIKKILIYVLDQVFVDRKELNEIKTHLNNNGELTEKLDEMLKNYLLELIPLERFLEQNSENNKYQKIGNIVGQSESSYYDILSFKDGSLERQLNIEPGLGKLSIWRFKKDIEAYVLKSLGEMQVDNLIIQKIMKYIMDREFINREQINEIKLALKEAVIKVQEIKTIEDEVKTSFNFYLENTLSLFKGLNADNPRFQRVGELLLSHICNLNEFLKGKEECYDILCSQPNVGRVGVKKFRSKFREFLFSQLSTRLKNDDLISIHGFISNEVSDIVELNSINETLKSLNANVKEHEDQTPVSASNKTLDLIIEEAFEKLNEKLVTIVKRRFGFIEPKLTLEELGEIFSITRERIRQLESKALKNISIFLDSFYPDLRASQESELESLFFADEDFVPFDEITEDNLEPERKLVIQAYKFDLHKILGKRNFIWRKAFFKQTIDKNSLEDLFEQFKRTKFDIQLPNDFSYFFKRTPTRLDNFILSKLKIGCRENLMFQGGYNTLRPTRTARIFNLPPIFGSVDGIYSAARIYREVFSDDQCTARDLIVLYQEHSHLFLVSNHSVIPLNTDRYRHMDKLVDKASDKEVNVPNQSNVGGLAKYLVEKLSSDGPQKLSDLIYFIERQNTPWSEHGVPLVLSSSPENFVRVLPYFWGSREIDENYQIKFLQQNLSKFICQEQIRYFVVAVYSGLNPDFFPWWNPYLKKLWYDWSKINSSSIYKILSAMLSPEGENISILENTDARESIEIDINKIYDKPLNWKDISEPSIEAFLFALHIIEKQGFLGLSEANFISSKEILSQKGLGLIVFLVLAGCLKADQINWMAPHYAGENIHRLKLILTEKILEGKIDKKDKISKSVDILTNEIDLKYSWINLSKLEQIDESHEEQNTEEITDSILNDLALRDLKLD